MGKMIPLSVPNFEGNEEKYVSEAVGQGWVSTAGAYIMRLEKQMATFLHTKTAVACQSGTSALHLAMMECEIKPGDGVIVPTITFIAAVNPVTYVGAIPIFMDCDESLCIDPLKVKAFCENECVLEQDQLYTKEGHILVKAIVPVHVFGNLCEMEKIMEIAAKYKLKVIEDATECLGSKFTTGKYIGRYGGTIGDFGAYSFNGNKIITTGGGGMLVSTNDEQLEHARYISTQAKDDLCFYIHHEIGYNYRMTNVQAAIGVAQMEELDEFIKRKRKNYEYYVHAFEDFSFAKLMKFREDTFSNCWFYSLLIDIDQVELDLRKFVETLQERGIQTRPIWGLIHEQKPYQNSPNYQIEQAVYYSKRILNLPCSTNITQPEMDAVVQTIKELLEETAYDQRRTE